MKIEHHWHNKYVVTSLIGELDAPITSEAWEQLLEVSDAAPQGLVLDLSKCTYIASSGIAIIVRLSKRLRAVHVPMRLTGASNEVRLVLETVNLLTLIPLDDSPLEAIAHLKHANEQAKVA